MSGWRRRLNDIQPFPPQICAHLDRVSTSEPRQRIANLGHAGSEVRRRALWRPNLLIPADEECRKRRREPRARRNTRKTQARRWSAAEANRRSIHRSSRVAHTKLVHDIVRKHSLIIRGKRLGPRVLRTQRPGCHTASLGKRRHRDEFLSKSSQATKSLIAMAGEVMIDPQTELILIDRLILRSPIVVRCSGAGRERISLQECASDRIHPLQRNCIARKLSTSRHADSGRDRCRRVEDGRNTRADRFGEDALALQHGGDRRDHGSIDRLPLALIVQKEECRILTNRPANNAAELIAPKPRFDRIRRGKEVSRVERFVPKKFKDAAADYIST